MRIRKQVYDLTKQDLRDCPIWEFALDEEGEAGQDEATVRPSDQERLAGYKKLGKVARQVFPLRYASDVRLASGSFSGVLAGFMHFRSFSDQTVLALT